jgi:hypothetical protein
VWSYSASSPPPLDADTLPMTTAPNLSSPRSQSALSTAALNGRWIPKDSAGSLGVETGWPADHPRLALEDLDIGAGVVGGSFSAAAGAATPVPWSLCPKPRPRRSTVNFLPIVMCLGLVRIPQRVCRRLSGPRRTLIPAVASRGKLSNESCFALPSAYCEPAVM